MPLPTANAGRLTFVFGAPYADGLATCSQELIGFTSSDPQLAVDTLALAAVDLVQLTCVNAATLIQLELKLGPEASGPTYVGGVGATGSQGTSEAFANSAILVRKTVTFSSNRLAGRMFWPFPPGAGSTDASGNWEAATRTQFQEAFDDFFDVFATQDLTPVIYPEGSSDPRSVERWQVQARPASQRRRLRR